MSLLTRNEQFLSHFPKISELIYYSWIVCASWGMHKREFIYMDNHSFLYLRHFIFFRLYVTRFTDKLLAPQPSSQDPNRASKSNHNLEDG